MKIFILVLLPLSMAWAEPDATEPTTENPAKKAEQVVEDSVHQVVQTLGEARERRAGANYFGLATFSPIDFLIPNKVGLTAGMILNPDRTWELEYLRGSLSVPVIVDDLGSMSDQRLTFLQRSYFGRNSFNFAYGLSFFDFSLHLGEKLLSRVRGGNNPGIDLVQMQSIGFNVALGNRWTLRQNITLGVDWISWAQPVFITSKKSAFLDYANSTSDRDDVDQALKIISYFPRLVFLKLQLGILF